jgi:putative transposase
MEDTFAFSQPGKLTTSGSAEMFNSKLSAECLNANWFLAVADSRKTLED